MVENRTKNWFKGTHGLILAYFRGSRGPEIASESPVLGSVSRVSVRRGSCLWHDSRTEKIEDHGYKNFVFSNHENKQVLFLKTCSYTIERVFEESKIVKG